MEISNRIERMVRIDAMLTTGDAPAVVRKAEELLQAVHKLDMEFALIKTQHMVHELTWAITEGPDSFVFVKNTKEEIMDRILLLLRAANVLIRDKLSKLPGYTKRKSGAFTRINQLLDAA